MLLYSFLLSFAFSEEAVGINKGEPAPFEGVLLPREMAIEILSDDYRSQLEMKQQIESEKKLCEEKLSFNEDMLEIKTDSYEKEIEYLNKAIENRNKMILKENSNFSKSINFIGGFVGGTTLTLAILWSVNQVNGN